MIKLLSLVPLARPYLANCPEKLVIEHLLRSARDFCTQTRVWRDEIYAGFGAGYPFADIDLDTGEALVSVLQVTPQGKTEQLIAAADPLALASAPGEPNAFAMINPTRMKIGPSPMKSFVAVVRIAVKPSLAATEIPAYLDEWAEGLAHGAVASLMMQPDAEWYNPDQARHHNAEFQKAIGNARRRTNKGFSDTSKRAYGGAFI